MRSPTLQDLPPPPAGRTGWPWTEESRQLPPLMEDGHQWPRISIVTPSFNQAEFIEETIRSVLLQGYPELEYIIIDGGSTDGAALVIEKYAHWLKYWVSESDRGQTHALNKGFNKASGEVHAYLNSDDIYCIDAFAQVAISFSGNLEKSIIANFSGYSWADGEDRQVFPAQISKPQLHVWLSSQASLLQQGTFWTRSLHTALGGFDESLRFCMDKDFFIRAIYQYGEYIGSKGNVVAGFRLHSEAKTSNLEAVMWSENAILWRKYSNLQSYVEILAKEYRELTSTKYFQLVFMEGSVKIKLTFLLLSLWHGPEKIASRYFWGALRKVLMLRAS